jgi:8-oxo-dGTP pyrophosphatase MutT (NUDIX family)
MSREIQKFMVSMKAFIVDGDRLLLLQESTERKFWEMPGGRIDVGEELVPSPDILRRELTEELGSDIRYDIIGPVVTWARQFPKKTGEFIFFVGYACRYVSGHITLSHEHVDYRWVTQQEAAALPLAAGYDRALDQFWKNR